MRLGAMVLRHHRRVTIFEIVLDCFGFGFGFGLAFGFGFGLTFGFGFAFGLGLGLDLAFSFSSTNLACTYLGGAAFFGDFSGPQCPTNRKTTNACIAKLTRMAMLYETNFPPNTTANFFSVVQ